ncbi:MAG: hypothetical protein JWQ81_2696 [Amycolatopsis sp.]|nr:hypothetical protein [Amycolatopsis sp.]
MIDVRLFEGRNDQQISLETIDTVIIQELKRQGLDALADIWVELRKAQKEERNRWYKPKGVRQENELFPCDLVELEFYGNTYHLNPDMVLPYQQLNEGGTGLLIHQAVLRHLLQVAKEIRGILIYLDWFEAAGAQWSTG